MEPISNITTPTIIAKVGYLMKTTIDTSINIVLNIDSSFKVNKKTIRLTLKIF